MTDYTELIKALRCCADDNIPCKACPRCAKCVMEHNMSSLFPEAADAIDELLKAAKAMHTWIFLNTGDEQKAYDECGLSDEMNAALGYCGQFVAEPPKGE